MSNPGDPLNPFANDVPVSKEDKDTQQPTDEIIIDENLPINTNEHDKLIVRKPKHLLKAHDEFANEKSDRAIRLFHSTIKKFLDDPTKEFLFLVNTDINKLAWKVEWANNPEYKGLTFIEKPDLDVDQNLSIRQTDAELPITVPIIDARSQSYASDDLGQHFPDQVLQMTNSNYWYSDDPNPKFLTLVFAKICQVKYVAINFHKPDQYPQTYNILYKTDKFDRETGDPIIKMVAQGVQTIAADGLQVVVLDKPILTSEMYIDVISPIAAINYVIAIQNEISEEALDMFIHTTETKTQNENTKS